MMKRMMEKEISTKQMKEEPTNENAYNLNMKEKEGMNEKMKSRNTRMMITLELMGNRKSRMNDNDEMDRELN
jgi:hypothetical protein